MTIQDISCLGRCSLTVALPILSAMGFETAIVPTAVLSTHTQFNGFTFHDLTDEMEKIKDHWVKEKFTFDTIYTGYLGSQRQIEIVKSFFETFHGEKTVNIVDPAMADNGRLYVGFDEAFAKEMLSLCIHADVCLPNISEAALMLGTPYPGEDASEETIDSLLRGLRAAGCRMPVITGVTLDDGTFGFVGLNTITGEFFRYGNKKVPFKSHGTGDVFASTFTGALTGGRNVYDSLCIAADYTAACIMNTYNEPVPCTYSVNFEAEIPYLLKRMKE